MFKVQVVDAAQLEAGVNKVVALGDAKPNVMQRHFCGSLRHSSLIILRLHMIIYCVVPILLLFCCVEFYQNKDRQSHSAAVASLP